MRRLVGCPELSTLRGHIALWPHCNELGNWQAPSTLRIDISSCFRQILFCHELLSTHVRIAVCGGSGFKSEGTDADAVDDESGLVPGRPGDSAQGVHHLSICKEFTIVPFAKPSSSLNLQEAFHHLVCKGFIIVAFASRRIMEPTDKTCPFPIGALPTELLLLIVSHLQVIRGLIPDRTSEITRREYNSQISKTLHSLTLTCQSLAVISTPLLYRSIVNNAHTPDTALELLRTLARKPKLAQHIQYVEYVIDEDEPRHPSTYYAKNHLDWIQDIIARAEWTVTDMYQMYHRNRNHSHFHFWTFDEREMTQASLWKILCLVKEHNSAFFALMAIMLLAGNLTEITLPYDEALAFLAYKLYPRNAGLQRLLISRAPGSTIITASQKGSLPERNHALENFMLRYLQEPNLDADPRTNLDLDELLLDVFEGRMPVVANIISYFTSLRSLCCRWRENEPHRPDLYPSLRDMQLPLLGQVLLQFEHCLESLTIDTLDCTWPIDIDSDVLPLGSLRNFRLLKHLDVSGLVLLGDYDTATKPALSSILPASLETLKIEIEWDDEIEEVLYAYASDCASFQPALRSIECSWRPAPKTIAERLILSYKNIGVDLVLDITSS